jgi:hypothetical protein
MRLKISITTSEGTDHSSIEQDIVLQPQRSQKRKHQAPMHIDLGWKQDIYSIHDPVFSG